MEAQNHVHSGCCSRVRKPQNSSGSQSLIRMTRSQAPQLLPGNGQCDHFLRGGLPHILSTPLSQSLSTSGPFNIPKPKGVMGRGGPESVGGSPESVICECRMLGVGGRLGLHCGFHVLYLPLLAHRIPVQRLAAWLPGHRYHGQAALSPSKAQAALEPPQIRLRMLST